MKKIVKNAIKCNHCGDIIISKHRHDFVSCSCGCCSVDGGNDYLRRGFIHSPDDFTEMSEFKDYNLNSNVITTKGNNCHYMLIGYDASNFYLLNLQTNDITTVQEQWFEERQIQPSKEYSFLNKYVNLKKIEVQQNISNISPLEHKYIDNCRNPDCDTCPMCTLTICLICGGSEGSLTTECSGENSYQKDEDVYSGKLDFRYGKWRPNICTRCMLWSSNKAIPNEIKYLQELLAENAPPNVLKEECNYIAKWINVEKGRL